MQSGTVLTCYEDSVGPTDRNFNFAQNACNYTQEMWDSGNFTTLKDCLMKISITDATTAMNVTKMFKKYLISFIELFCPT